MDVIKRNRRRQRFSKTKLEKSIIKASRGAKIASSKARELARDISESVRNSLRGKRSVRTTDLRRLILRRLDTRARSVASSWRRYDRRR